jgi:hypothetical protein
MSLYGRMVVSSTVRKYESATQEFINSGYESQESYPHILGYFLRNCG